ncbi:MAG: FHA domain-containing protein [Anaerolineae bacterium]
MLICPQCARQNQPHARFCDRCGHAFGVESGPVPAASLAAAPGADRLPPGDTAKGMPAAQAGVPEEVRPAKGVYRQTQKLDAPAVSAAHAPDRNAHNQETIKIARVALPQADTGADDDRGPQPEATIQGAFYLRKQEAGRAASAEEHVGWLVEAAGSRHAPGAIWPVKTGLNLIGRSPTEVGQGVVADRPGLAPLHTAVFHREGQTWVLDLGTPTGTQLNGAALAPLQGHLLAERDEIRCGDLVLAFRRAVPAVQT